MLNILLILIPITSLSAFGFHIACRFENYQEFDKKIEKGNTGIHVRAFYPLNEIDSMELFWWVRYYGCSLPWWIRKPLYYCPMCMSSLWAAALCATAWYLTGNTAIFALLPFQIAASCGLTGYLQYNLNSF